MTLPKKKIPARVLTQAQRQALAVKERPSHRLEAPTTTRKAKVVAALKKLHPMD